MGERIFDTTERRGKKDAHILTKRQRRYLPLKRAMDIVFSAAALGFLAFPMLLIALTLKLLYPASPVFFRQKRVGRDGELFTLVKFSSMRNNVPPSVWTKKAADRREYITGYGRFLRSTSLDELPQLFQVLCGRMSLIGPRPLIPQERNMHVMRWEDGVYQLRPGLTGWAQVNGRDLLADEEKAVCDREYLEKMGFLLDWRIFWKTMKQVLLREGVDE